MVLTPNYCSFQILLHEYTQAADRPHLLQSVPKNHHTQSPTVHYGRFPNDQMSGQKWCSYPGQASADPHWELQIHRQIETAVVSK